MVNNGVGVKHKAFCKVSARGCKSSIRVLLEFCRLSEGCCMFANRFYKGCSRVLCELYEGSFRV